jgi:hypothetical protein
MTGEKMNSARTDSFLPSSVACAGKRFSLALAASNKKLEEASMHV